MHFAMHLNISVHDGQSCLSRPMMQFLQMFLPLESYDGEHPTAAANRVTTRRSHRSSADCAEDCISIVINCSLFNFLFTLEGQGEACFSCSGAFYRLMRSH
ncbi:hypothetical protein Droror1_Dr00016275 [Drosera rotundifolia]